MQRICWAEPGAWRQGLQDYEGRGHREGKKKVEEQLWLPEATRDSESKVSYKGLLNGTGDNNSL